MRKVSLPAVMLAVTVIAIILILVTSMPLERDRERGDTGVSYADTYSEAVVDEKGRWVVMLGEVELRIPNDRRSQPPSSVTYELYPEALCLQERYELADCFEIRDRIRIFLMARLLKTPPPKCNIDHDYSDGALNGPFTTANAEVELYKTESGATRRYVFRKSDETCWHPTARCNALRCLSSYNPQPGVHVRYEFDEGSIGSWPTIHARVNDHVTPLFAWK